MGTCTAIDMISYALPAAEAARAGFGRLVKVSGMTHKVMKLTECASGQAMPCLVGRTLAVRSGDCRGIDKPGVDVDLF